MLCGERHMELPYIPSGNRRAKQRKSEIVVSGWAELAAFQIASEKQVVLIKSFVTPQMIAEVHRHTLFYCVLLY